jgi:hypothetical protein
VDIYYKQAEIASELLKRPENKIVKLLGNEIIIKNNQVFITNLEKKITGNYLVIVDRMVRKRGGDQIIVYEGQIVFF